MYHFSSASNMHASHDMSMVSNCVVVAFNSIVQRIFRAMLCARRHEQKFGEFENMSRNVRGEHGEHAVSPAQVKSTAG